MPVTLKWVQWPPFIIALQSAHQHSPFCKFFLKNLYCRFRATLILQGVTELDLELQAHIAEFKGVSKKLYSCYGTLLHRRNCPKMSRQLYVFVGNNVFTQSNSARGTWIFSMFCWWCCNEEICWLIFFFSAGLLPYFYAFYLKNNRFESSDSPSHLNPPVLSAAWGGGGGHPYKIDGVAHRTF